MKMQRNIFVFIVLLVSAPIHSHALEKNNELKSIMSQSTCEQYALLKTPEILMEKASWESSEEKMCNVDSPTKKVLSKAELLKFRQDYFKECMENVGKPDIPMGFIVSNMAACRKMTPALWVEPVLSDADKKACTTLSEIIVPEKLLHDPGVITSNCDGVMLGKMDADAFEYARKSVYESCFWMQKDTRDKMLNYYKKCSS